MARKKSRKMTTTTKKTAAKRQSNKTPVNMANTLEREFIALPAKLVAHLRKEATTLTQQEKKLRVELKKFDAQKKTLKTKRTALISKNKQKPSATNKKQIKLMTATHDKAHKAAQTLMTQLDHLKIEIRTIVTKQAKFGAIASLLTKFAKEWEQKAKKAATKATKATKSRKKSAKSKKLAMDAATPVLENASFHISASSESSDSSAE